MAVLVKEPIALKKRCVHLLSQIVGVVPKVVEHFDVVGRRRNGNCRQLVGAAGVADET